MRQEQIIVSYYKELSAEHQQQIGFIQSLVKIAHDANGLLPKLIKFFISYGRVVNWN